jgi:hypothetical protein
LLALVAHGSASSYANQAWPRERLGAHETQPTLSVLRDQLLAFGRQRSTWVSVRRQRLHALVGARERGGHQAWEIDYLVDCTGDEGVVVELLTRAIQAAGESRAEKLFLRLDASSPLLTAAHEAGFMPYQEETLYVHPGGIRADPAPVRAMAPADSYPLFRLYTASTPEAVRRYEAATFSEWQAGTERRWLRGGVHLICERDGKIIASVRAAKLAQGVLLDLTLGPESLEEAEGLVAAAGRRLDTTGAPLLMLVPNANPALARRLEDAGFQPGGEFVSLMLRTTRPLNLPKAIPAVAKNAIGV